MLSANLRDIVTASKIDNITLALIGLCSNETPVKTTQQI